MRRSWHELSWPVIASVMLHALLVAGVVLAGLLSTRQLQPSVEPLPIDAVVVDSQILKAAQRIKTERADQEAARVQAAADARAAAEAKVAAAAEEQAAEAATAQQQRQAEAQKILDSQKLLEAQKAAALAQQHAALEQAARAQELKAAAAAKSAADDAQRAVDAKQAADAKRAADDRARKDRETELQRQLADEEHRSAVEAGPLRDRYIASLRNKIQNAWNRPPSARVGVDCLVEVTQVPGGEVTAAHVTQCNGDAAVRQSIENAVYRASPLPDPPDQALFERNFVFRFRPNE